MKKKETTPGNGKKAPATSKEVNYRSVYLGIVRGAPLPESLSLFDVVLWAYCERFVKRVGPARSGLGE